MRHTKVLCISCLHYRKCSQQTRMYVNYCGTRIKNLKVKIDEAFAECRAHGGLIFKEEILSPFHSRLKTPQFDLSTV